MADSLDTNDFWITYVLHGIAIDKTNSIVPTHGLPKESATLLAERLRLMLLMSDKEYVFHLPKYQASRTVVMESADDVPDNPEDRWTSLVHDFKTFGSKEAILPLTSFSYETAKAVAAKLKLALEMRDRSFHLYKPMPDNIIVPGSLL